MLALVGCSDEAAAPDLSVPADLSAAIDQRPACTHVASWPGAGTAFFTPLGHAGQDVVTVRSNLIVAASDGGPRTDQMMVELRQAPGASLVYPRTITLAPTTLAGCSECVSVGKDVVSGTPMKRFVATSGTLFISRADQAATGRIEMMGGALTLAEWSSGDTAVSDGGCYTIDQVTFSLDYSQGPNTGQNDM